MINTYLPYHRLQSYSIPTCVEFMVSTSDVDDQHNMINKVYRQKIVQT